MNRPAVMLLAGAALMSLAGSAIAPAQAAPLRGVPASGFSTEVSSNILQAQAAEVWAGRPKSWERDRRRWRYEERERWHGSEDRGRRDWRRSRDRRHHHYHRRHASPPPFFYGFPFFFAPHHR